MSRGHGRDRRHRRPEPRRCGAALHGPVSGRVGAGSQQANLAGLPRHASPHDRWPAAFGLVVAETAEKLELLLPDTKRVTLLRPKSSSGHCRIFRPCRRASSSVPTSFATCWHFCCAANSFGSVITKTRKAEKTKVANTKNRKSVEQAETVFCSFSFFFRLFDLSRFRDSHSCVGGEKFSACVLIEC